MRALTRPDSYCGRCSLRRDKLTKITVTRDDGYKLTIKACDKCAKALREGARNR